MMNAENERNKLDLRGTTVLQSTEAKRACSKEVFQQLSTKAWHGVAKTSFEKGIVIMIILMTMFQLLQHENLAFLISFSVKAK